jgi:hypothetical protein
MHVSRELAGCQAKKRILCSFLPDELCCAATGGTGLQNYASVEAQSEGNGSDRSDDDIPSAAARSDPGAQLDSPQEAATSGGQMASPAQIAGKATKH